MLHLRAFCFLCLCWFPSFLTANPVDSLKKLLESTVEQTPRMQLLYQLTDELYSVKPEEAKIYAEEALFIAEELKDVEMQAKSQSLLIYIYYFLGDPDSGIRAGTAATQLAKTLQDPILEANSYYTLGYHYYDKGLIKQAMNSFQKCLEISEQYDYSKGISKGSKGLGDLNESSGNYQEALKDYENCLKIGLGIEDQRGIMLAYNDLGRIYDQMGIYDLGLKHYLQALKLAEVIDDGRGKASFTFNIAGVHFFQKNYPKALEYAELASALFVTNEDEAGKAKTLQLFGNIWFNQGQYDKALTNYQEAFTIQQKRNNQRGLSYAYFNIAKTYLKKGAPKEALALHLKSLELREKIDFQLGIAGSALEIGRIYSSRQEFDQALEYLQRSSQLAQETGAYQEMNDAYSALADLYHKMRDFQSAYKYQDLYQKTRDSLFNQDRNQAIANMQISFETEKKEVQISSLEEEKVLFADLHKKDQQIKILLAVGLLLLLGTAFLFWNQSRLKHRANSLLQSKNGEIAQKGEALELSLKEKEVLLREVHHRVKNNLQMVSSLLNLQASEVQNENVLASIREGKGRIEAMSLIHENLYQSSQLNEINIEQYLMQLLKHLEQAFAQKGKSIKLSLEATGIRFNIDTAIPLGLVINELVTNAYKYAFTARDIGEITISIRGLSDDTYELQVADNGQGLPPGMEIKKSSSLGLRLVNMLSTLQLKGDLSYRYHNGSEFKINFKDLRSPQVKMA